MNDQAMLDVVEVDPNGLLGELELSAQERKVLELYDRLEEVNLESSFLQAAKALANHVHDGTVTEGDIQNAKLELLEAKAAYNLRNSIVDSVLIARPVLQAVHAGENASLIEKDLLPLIKTRDELAISITSTSARILATREALTKAKLENHRTSQKNTEMAAVMMKLAQEANSQNKEDIQDPEIRAQLQELESELKESRQRWRMMKGMTSAVIAGSGVDWARDPVLRDLVLDNDEDDDG